jgi:hypothetical protein
MLGKATLFFKGNTGQVDVRGNSIVEAIVG